MKATLVEKKKVFIRCPNCGDENSHDISALDTDVAFGPSYCNSCGTGIRGYVDDASVEINVAEDRREPAFVLLRMNPQDIPIYLIIGGANFIAHEAATGSWPGEKDFLDSDEFFYNHNCHPTVVLQQAVAVIRAGDVNPQGIFEYITSRCAPSPAVLKDGEVAENLLNEFIPLTVPTPSETTVAARGDLTIPENVAAKLPIDQLTQPTAHSPKS